MEATIDTLVQFFASWGYWGIFLAALAAGTVIPFSSELVLVMLVHAGLNPVWCVAVATTGNTLGSMTCYWIGTRGKSEWIRKLGVSDQKLTRARKFLGGRGAMMAFFCFIPTIGEAIAIALGLMRSNPWLTAGSMFTGKLIRYIAVVATYEGAVALF